MINKDKLVESYLFCGPSDIGKTEITFDFISKVNATVDCAKIKRGANPDVIIVAPVVEEKNGKSRKKDISIEQIKSAIKKVGFYAYNSKYKFLVIKEAEKMTSAAANSLLKIIEDPTPDTIVILISNNEMGTLPTIRSRCQIVRFGLSTEEAIISQLQSENIELEAEELFRIVSFSQGKIVKARKFLQNRDEFTLAQERLESFKSAMKSGVVAGMNLSEEVFSDKEKLKVFLDEIVWYLRNLVKKQIDDGNDIRMIGKISTIVERVIKLRTIIATGNANQRLQLENFFVQL